MAAASDASAGSTDADRPASAASGRSRGSTAVAVQEAEAVAAVDSGPTAVLHAAARVGETSKVQAAIDAGADVNAIDLWGLGALHSASQNGHKEVVQCLLDGNAEINAMSLRNRTPLHLAAMQCHDEVVALLFESGANVLERTGHGNTSLEVAQQFGPGGPCERQIRAELERRWLQADVEVEDLRARLAIAEQTRSSCEAQLGGPPVRDMGVSIGETNTANAEAAGEEAGTPAEKTAAAVDADDATQHAKLTSQESPQAFKHFEEAVSEPVSPTSVVSNEPGQRGSKKKKTPSGIAQYWLSFERLVNRSVNSAEQAMLRTHVRELPREPHDPYPWIGPFKSTAALLPLPDEEDVDMLKSQARLREATAHQREREAKRGPIEKEEALLTDERLVRAHQDQQMRRQTGRTQHEWNELVEQLRTPGATWDWSRVEVRDRRKSTDAGPMPKGMGMIGVFAVACESSPSASAGTTDDVEIEDFVFRKGDVIGPLGGVLRRQLRYQQRYYPGCEWDFHDPLAYEMRLRIQTSELRLEPLVLDLAAGGEVQNRLRHLADFRVDPVQLRSQIGTTGKEGATFPQRAPMPRPRSRQSMRIPAAKDEPGERDVSATPGVDMQQAGAQTANIVEVLVEGWPYAFAVAHRDVKAGEELTIDLGEAHWMRNRLTLSRLNEIGKLCRDVLTGVRGDRSQNTDEKDESAELFPQRRPMRKVVDGFSSNHSRDK